MINHRIFVLASVIIDFWGCNSGQHSDTGATTSAKKPNIIFIMADDLGYRDLGCYSQTNILTPNIDKMAAEGLKFTNVYAGSTVCAPSRSVLMTGKHTGNTTVRGNFSKVDRSSIDGHP